MRRSSSPPCPSFLPTRTHGNTSRAFLFPFAFTVESSATVLVWLCLSRRRRRGIVPFQTPTRSKDSAYYVLHLIE
jgi:hypothetical protein